MLQKNAGIFQLEKSINIIYGNYVSNFSVFYFGVAIFT